MEDRHSCRKQGFLFFLVVILLLESTSWFSKCKHNEFTLGSISLLHSLSSLLGLVQFVTERKWARHLRERS